MKVFLSHASQDNKVAKEICLALRGAGHEVFFDASDLPPGGDYNTRIRNAIDSSSALVFLVSPHALMRGKYTLTELKFAKQKWPKPWGHVLPVMVEPTPWKDVDPYLKATTVLTPAGEAAPEVADALAKLPDTAEARAESARVRSPLVAMQAALAVAMILALALLALAFGIEATVVRQGAAVTIGVVALCAGLMAAVGAAQRARDASLRSLRQAYRGVLAASWFAALSAALTAAVTALFAWQLATLNRVTFAATTQDVELFLSDKRAPAQSLGTIKGGETRNVVLRVGTRTILYRRVNGTEIGLLDPVVIPRLWSGAGGQVIALPELRERGTLIHRKE